MRRLLSAMTVLIVAAVLLVAAWPQLFGLQRQFVVSQLVSLRGLDAAVAAVGVVALLLIALLWRRARRLAATLAIMMLVFAGVNVAVVTVRGTTPPGFQSKAAGDITVLSWNTEGDAPGATEIARLALAQNAQIVALPETSEVTAQAVAVLMGNGGIPMQVLNVSFDTVAKAHSTSLLVAYTLGEYRRDDSHGSTKTLPSVVAVPADGAGPTIVAAHSVAPVPGEMSNWRYDLGWLAARCGSGGSSGGSGGGSNGNVIMSGDFNSTLDHWDGLGSGGDLGSCHDGARAWKSAGVASWPTSLPPTVGTPIDHVIATGSWTFVGFRVIGNEDGAGSDHRPVVGQLRAVGVAPSQ
jgi:endonuclease/exonuclease/phosphatase (EEP) superfamily protein YafD